MGFKPTNTSDHNTHYPVIDGDPGEKFSVESCKEFGYHLREATIVCDGYGICYMLVEQNGVKKWLALRFD